MVAALPGAVHFQAESKGKGWYLFVLLTLRSESLRTSSPLRHDFRSPAASSCKEDWEGQRELSSLEGRKRGSRAGGPGLLPPEAVEFSAL